MKKILPVIILMIVLVASSCKKPAGEGGNSTITGKVHVKNYNSTFTVLTSEYDGPDVDVYIIYGDDVTYGNRLKTSPDGVYEFKYLRPGKYKIYAYSKDKDAFLAGNPSPPNKAIYQEVEISKKKQTVEVPTIEIIN
jgi:lipocalin